MMNNTLTYKIVDVRLKQSRNKRTRNGRGEEAEVANGTYTHWLLYT